MKRLAFISLTAPGKALAASAAARLPELEIRQFCFAAYADAETEAFDSLAALTAALFPDYDALVFVGACGIAVRMIAPHLRSKQTDPAVLCMDQSGKFVIPLLSGHIGGANALAERIAAVTGAVPVITTASDTGGLFSPDSFAAANQLVITDTDAAKAIAAAVIQGGDIGFRSELPHPALPKPLTAEGCPRCGIVIANECTEPPFPVTLHLIPKNLVIGIGCRRGTSCPEIAAAVLNRLAANGLDPRRICAAATVDLKADEPGLLAFCKAQKLPLHTYSAEQLMQVSGDFTASAFVSSITGADNICERSAVLCSGGTLVMRKQAADGVTVAAAEMPLRLDFERKLL